VFGTMTAIAALAPKCNVLGCMALVENAIGEEAQHPYDIVKSYKGLTVHIDNTDAEGRVSSHAISPIRRCL
jgi:leucyl aminopeptidase